MSKKKAPKAIIALYILCTSHISIGPCGGVVKSLGNGATDWSYAEGLGFKSG